jgi:hypothetical protein
VLQGRFCQERANFNILRLSDENLEAAIFESEFQKAGFQLNGM